MITFADKINREKALLKQHTVPLITSTIWSKKSRKQRRHKLNKAESINHSSYLKQFTMILSLPCMFASAGAGAAWVCQIQCARHTQHTCIRDFFLFVHEIVSSLKDVYVSVCTNRLEEVFWVESIFNISSLRNFEKEIEKFKIAMETGSLNRCKGKCIFNSQTRQAWTTNKFDRNEKFSK